MIIQSEPQQIRGETIVRCRHRKLVIGEIEIEPFRFGRPVLREANFGADARGPAEAGVAFRRIPECDAGELAVSETCGAEDQHIIDCDAGAPARSAEPRVRKLPRRECIFGCGQADVRLAAIDQIAILPVEAGFKPAGNAVRTRWIVVDAAPFIAEGGADIRSGPSVRPSAGPSAGPSEREIARRSTVEIRRKVSSAGGACCRDRGSRQQGGAGNPACKTRQSLSPQPITRTSGRRRLRDLRMLQSVGETANRRWVID